MSVSAHPVPGVPVSQGATLPRTSLSPHVYSKAGCPEDTASSSCSSGHTVQGGGRRERHGSFHCGLEPGWEEPGPGAGPRSTGCRRPGDHRGDRKRHQPGGPNWAPLCAGRGRTPSLSRTLVKITIRRPRCLGPGPSDHTSRLPSVHKHAHAHTHARSQTHAPLQPPSCLFPLPLVVYPAHASESLEVIFKP